MCTPQGCVEGSVTHSQEVGQDCQLSEAPLPTPHPPAPYLHLPILRCIVEGGPPPGVSHDGGTHQQEPVQNGRVAAPSSEVQDGGPLVIPSCQADVGEGDLWTEEGGRAR